MERVYLPRGSLQMLRRIYAEHGFGRGRAPNDSRLDPTWRPSELELDELLVDEIFADALATELSLRAPGIDTDHLFQYRAIGNPWVKPVLGLSTADISNHKIKGILEDAGKGVVSRRSLIEFLMMRSNNNDKRKWLADRPDWVWGELLWDSELVCSSSLLYDHGEHPVDTLCSLAGFDFHPPHMLISSLGISGLYCGSAGRELLRVALEDRVEQVTAYRSLSRPVFSYAGVRRILDISVDAIRGQVHAKGLMSAGRGLVDVGSLVQFLLTRTRTGNGWERDVSSPYLRLQKDFDVEAIHHSSS